MKPTIGTTALLATVFVLGAASIARADTFDVKVPFSFVVKGQTMPPGQYRVDDEGGVILLHGAQPHAPGLFILTTPAAGRDPSGNRPSLTFARDESTYRLTRIWESGVDGVAVLH